MYVKQAGLLALMALGSVSLWVLNPLLWFWLTSHLQSAGRATADGPYALLLIGVILTAVALAKALAALNRRYGRLIGTEPTVRIIVPWRRSLRDARHGSHEDPGAAVNVLDVVMVLSVLAAIIAFAVWYLVTDPHPAQRRRPRPVEGLGQVARVRFHGRASALPERPSLPSAPAESQPRQRVMRRGKWNWSGGDGDRAARAPRRTGGRP